MNYTKVLNSDGTIECFGEFVGLLSPSGCDRCGDETPTAVIRSENFGLYLKEVHPSRAIPITRSEYLALVAKRIRAREVQS